MVTSLELCRLHDGALEEDWSQQYDTWGSRAWQRKKTQIQMWNPTVTRQTRNRDKFEIHGDCDVHTKVNFSLPADPSYFWNGSLCVMGTYWQVTTDNIFCSFNWVEWGWVGFDTQLDSDPVNEFIFFLAGAIYLPCLAPEHLTHPQLFTYPHFHRVSHHSLWWIGRPMATAMKF